MSLSELDHYRTLHHTEEMSVSACLSKAGNNKRGERAHPLSSFLGAASNPVPLYRVTDRRRLHHTPKNIQSRWKSHDHLNHCNMGTMGLHEDEGETDSKDRLPESSSLAKSQPPVRIRRNLESQKVQLGIFSSIRVGVVSVSVFGRMLLPSFFVNRLLLILLE